MKKLLIIAIIFSISFSVYAQRGPQKEMPKPEERAERMTNRMAEQLELTEAQKQEIYTIHLQNAQKRQAEMEARRVEMEARREAMKAQMESQKEQIESILTPEQREKWEEVRSENRSKIEDRNKKGRRGTGAEKISDEKRGYHRFR